jgi:DnaJ-class molecular chaperone
MTQRETCPKCHGAGWDVEYYEKQHKATSPGKGSYTAVDNAIREEAMRYECDFCGGTGIVSGQDRETE